MPQPDAFSPPARPPGQATAGAEERNNFGAILWLLASIVAASSMTVAVRQVSLDIDTRMIVLLRALITLAIIVPIFLAIPAARRHLRFTRPWLHLFRGTLIAFATHLGYYTLANIPLATAAVLFFMAPVFATVFAALVHGEKVGPRRRTAVATGFFGALIILRPDAGDLHPAMIAALGSSLCFAGALTMSRGLASADGPTSALVSAVVILAVISVPLAWPVFSVPSGGAAWFATAILVIAGTVRGYADIQAYRLGEAAILAPITYLRLVLIGLLGYLFFGETLDKATIVGAAVIIAATLYIALREARLRKT